MPSTNDIINAICFAATVELKPSYYEDRREPQSTPTRNPIYSDQPDDSSRLKRVLDSLAMLCIYQEHKQVFAVGLRNAGSEVELLVAENGSIEPKTIEHLRTIWTKLQILSKRFEKHHGHSIDKSSPRQPELVNLNEETQSIILDIQQTALKFVLLKLKKRLSKHFDLFEGMKIAKGHFFSAIYQTVVVLDDIMGGDKIPSESDWTHIAQFLDLIQHKIGFLEPDWSSELKAFTPKPFDIPRYIMKIVSLSKNIQVLINAANSPRLRSIFGAKLIVTALEPTLLQTYVIPEKSSEWRQVISQVLEEKNRNKEFGEDEYELTKIAGENAQQIAKKILKYRKDQKDQEEPLKDTPNVHCECRIIQYTFEPGAPQIYSYIGVSKLSCNGCWEYMQAVNSAYATKFQTKGTHQKWYYPWGFAVIPRSETVTATMYTNICQKIGLVYPGYKAKSRSIHSDSDPQSISDEDKPSGSYSPVEDLMETMFDRMRIRKQ